MDLEALMYPLRTFINLYIALMMVFFFYAMLSPAAKFRAGRTLAGSYALCLGSLLLSAVIYDYYVAKLVVTVLVLALGLGLLYRAPFSRRVLASTFYVILLMFAEAIIAALTVLFYGFSGISMTAQAQAVAQGFPLYMFAYTLAFGLPAFVAWQRPRGEGSINLTRFLALPFSQAVGLGALLYAMYTSARSFGPVDSAVTIIVIALSIVTDIVFLHTVDALVQKKRLEEQQRLMKQHYLALMDQQRTIRSLRHDMANHLTTLQRLVQEGSPRAQAYAEELSQRFHQVQRVDFCENQIADVVLSSKAEEAAGRGIRFTVSAPLPPELPVEDVDLMSLLSNLLDNALEAAGQAEDPWVEVTLRTRAGTLAVGVRNALPPGPAPDLGQTTKADKARHGLGVRIVEDICKKYHGSFTAQGEAGAFQVRALLLFPQDPKPPGTREVSPP